MEAFLKEKTLKYFVSILIPFLFLVDGCKIRKDEDTVIRFFSLLKESKYDESLKLTEGGAETLMKKLTKEQPEEIANIVFKNMILEKVSIDDLLTSQETESIVYRANYRFVLKEDGIKPDANELLIRTKGGEVIVYINKKTSKIKSLIDLKGGVFVAP